MGRYSDVYCGIDATHFKSNLTKFNKINKELGWFEPWKKSQRCDDSSGYVHYFKATWIKWDEYCKDNKYIKFIESIADMDDGFLVAVDEGGEVYGAIGDPWIHLSIYTQVELV